MSLAYNVPPNTPSISLLVGSDLEMPVFGGRLLNEAYEDASTLQFPELPRFNLHQPRIILPTMNNIRIQQQMDLIPGLLLDVHLFQRFDLGIGFDIKNRIQTTVQGPGPALDCSSNISSVSVDLQSFGNVKVGPVYLSRLATFFNERPFEQCVGSNTDNATLLETLH